VHPALLGLLSSLPMVERSKSELFAGKNFIDLDKEFMISTGDLSVIYKPYRNSSEINQKT
jgi:hypothetical protein